MSRIHSHHYLSLLSRFDPPLSIYTYLRPFHPLFPPSQTTATQLKIVDDERRDTASDTNSLSIATASLTVVMASCSESGFPGCVTG